MNSAVHWNFHQLCAIDVETTGLDPEQHEIIQIAIVPIAPDLKPRKDVLPFYMEFAPMFPERAEKGAFRVNKLNPYVLRETAVDQWRGAELFEEWLPKLQLPFGKKILPLAHNWPFEAGFLRKWLGSRAFDEFFFGFRDTMALCNMLNDMADMQNLQWPFPKVNLEYVATTLRIENPNPHDALGDAVTTAHVYRVLMTKYRVV